MEQLGEGAQPQQSGTKETTYKSIMKTYLESNKTRPVKGFKALTPALVLRSQAKIYESILADKTLTVASKRSHLSALLYYLKAAPKVSQVLLDKISKEATDLNKIVEKRNMDNVLEGPRAENPLTWDKLKNKVAEVNNLFKKNFKNKTVNIDLLMLRLAFNQPPLRSEPTEMEIVNESDVNPKETTNLLVTRKDGTRYYLMRDYKTVNKYHEQEIDIKHELYIAIDLSLKHYPRKWLLALSNKNSPLGYQNYRKRLALLLGNHQAVDVLRSLYISHFLESHRSGNAIQELSEMMLTSVKILTSVYRKIPNDIQVKPDPKPYVPFVSERGKQMTPEESRANRLAYQKARYQMNKESIKEKTQETFNDKKTEIYRKRIIKKVKEDRELGITTVRPETIAKYKITEADLD